MIVDYRGSPKLKLYFKPPGARYAVEAPAVLPQSDLFAYGILYNAVDIN